MRRWEAIRRRAELPRIALVKQDCNEDLYCCPSDATTAEMLRSTLLRSGPVALFTRFPARFFILRTEADPECAVWYEKVEPLGWAPASWFESFRDHVPGRDHGQSRFAVCADQVDWSQFDLVISVDVAVPARITAKYPGVVWAYYIREIKAPSWQASFERPAKGQDLYLTHAFAPKRTRGRPHVVDFPYHFHYPGIFHEVFGKAWPDPSPRQGIFVDYHSARAASVEQLRALGAFGQVYACRAEDDRFDPKTGERIPERSMSPAGLKALLTSKYHVRWGGRNIFGTAKVEAIAAGCLALSDRNRDATLFLQSGATAIDDFASLITALQRLEADENLYRREVTRQRAMVEYLCFLRPAGELLDACARVRKRKPNALSQTT